MAEPQFIRPDGIPSEEAFGTPAILNLGPVTVRSGATLDVKVIRAPAASATGSAPSPRIEIDVPPTAAERVNATSWLMATTGFGGWLGGTLLGVPGAVIGGTTGFAWGVYKWNRWHHQ